MKATIRLFKGVPIGTPKYAFGTDIHNETIPKGFIFSKEVTQCYNHEELLDLVKDVEEELSLTAEQMNASFHKSWDKIRTASMEQLVVEQMIHYITTYGFEAFGIYSDSTVYIPKEKLEIPNIDLEKLHLIVIKGYTKEELKEKLMNILKSGIALKEETMNDIYEVISLIELGIKDVELIRNKEVKIGMYERLKYIPEDPVEFLRYCVYKSTGKTLLIKDKETMEKIREVANPDVYQLFLIYKHTYGLNRLAEIFYRFKPIFLAYRSDILMKSMINKIRKLAVENHDPMPEDYLNSVTGKIKNGANISIFKLEEELNRTNIFRKVRLAYALNYRMSDADSIVYKVRNGKGYATEFHFENKGGAQNVLNMVLESIEQNMRRINSGRKIYIPKDIVYTLPATEKQFIGNVPCGSYITVPKDMVMGVHWTDIDHHRIDLDLSMISIKVGKIGWDSCYRTADKTVLFSGDLTSAPAPKGASELFYVQKQEEDRFIILLNYFNYDEKPPVPFKIFVAEEEISKMKRNYMVDPNNVKAILNMKIDKHQKVLGLLTVNNDESRFYFAEVDMGSNITASHLPYIEYARKYLIDFYKNAITLNDMLTMCGAVMVDTKEECDIDLSPEALEKDTILNLMR